jgi:hypothetical protein
MQLRYLIDLTIEEYIEQKAWEHAELDHCPFHPEGGCGLARHGTYPRKFPEYCLVPRWYCPGAHRTISLLPDFFASRFPGTLDEIEDAVNTAVSCKSQEEAAFVLRPEISLPSGLRWLRRRIQYVKAALTILAGLLVTECAPDLESFRKKIGANRVLSKLREMAREYLPSMPPVVGFGPRLDKRYCHFGSPNN